MVSIKHYYDLKRELEIAQLRLKALLEKRDLYFNNTQPGGMNYDNTIVDGGTANNSFDIYVEKVEELDVQIKLLEAEIIILQQNLKNIENALRKMKGSLYKVFVARYIDGLSINQIARKMNYSRSQVYRKLQIIKNITKDATKCDK